MARSGEPTEIRQLARYQVRPEALETCLAAIRTFVAYVRANEPGTLRYDVWQERDEPTRFVHRFVFRDAAAHRVHSASREVQAFAGGRGRLVSAARGYAAAPALGACRSTHALKTHTASAEARPIAIRISQPSAFCAGTSSSSPSGRVVAFFAMISLKM